MGEVNAKGLSASSKSRHTQLHAQVQRLIPKAAAYPAVLCSVYRAIEEWSDLSHDMSYVIATPSTVVGIAVDFVNNLLPLPYCTPPQLGKCTIIVMRSFKMKYVEETVLSNSGIIHSSIQYQVLPAD